MRNVVQIIFLFAISAATSAADFDDWYQVEVIVFKQLDPGQTNELWSQPRNAYPVNMKAIAAASPDRIKPHLLGQLQQLAEEDAITISGEVLEVESGFLFEDRASSRIVRKQSDSLWGNENTEPGTSDEADADSSARLNEQLDEQFAQNSPQPFRALPDDVKTLASIASSLSRSKGYRILLHEAWAQPLSSSPTPILIQAGEQYNDQYEVDGTLWFSRSRFLHVQTDLWFTQFDPAPGQAFLPAGQIDPEWNRDYKTLVEAGTLRRNYQPVLSAPMQHSRRMRSDTVHYIDHPYFGVIVNITEYTHRLTPGDILSGSAR